MSRLLICVVSVLLSPPSSAAGKESAVVVEARQRFRTIKGMSLQLLETSLGSGKPSDSEGLRVYHREGTVHHIEHYESEGHCEGISHDFYFWRGELFFVFAQTQCYETDWSGEPPHEETWSYVEDRYYLQGGKVTHWLSKSTQGDLEKLKQLRAQREDLRHAPTDLAARAKRAMQVAVKRLRTK